MSNKFCMVESKLTLEILEMIYANFLGGSCSYG